VVVTNRSPERATALAAELGGRAVRLRLRRTALEQIDIAISSTAAPHYDCSTARSWSIDAPPANTWPAAAHDIARAARTIDPRRQRSRQRLSLQPRDDLASIAADYLNLRKEEVARCAKDHREKVAALMESE